MSNHDRALASWAFTRTLVMALVVLVGGDAIGGMSDLPLGLPTVPVPALNPLTMEKVALGERLFFDPGLSADGSVSCSSCHRPERFFGDESARSVGALGLEGSRNVSSLLNAAYSPVLLSDGRATSLEDQVQYPVANPLEMNQTQEGLVEYLAGQASYGPLFELAFGDRAVTWERVTQALASFERTLTSGNAPFDRFMAGNEAAISSAAKRGWDLFRGQAGCIECHAYTQENPFFTDYEFHNTGVGRLPETPLPPDERFKPDLGHYWVSRDGRHLGAFRTPSLRNVAMTAPYMHNGHFRTLEEVVDHYALGASEGDPLDRRRAIELSLTEKESLIEFLRSLTGETKIRQPAVELAAKVSRPTESGSKPQRIPPRVEIIAGGTSLGDGGKAIEAVFVNIGGMAVDASGNLFVVDSGAGRVRRIDAATGKIGAVAGTGLMGGALDSAVALDRPLRGPVSLAIDAERRALFISEVLARRVLRLDLESSVIKDLGAPPEGFGSPDGLLSTANGLVVADGPRGQLWRLAESGVWSGLLPDGVRLTDGIRTMAEDAQGRIYLSEYFAHRILRFDPRTGGLERAAGTGESGRGEEGALATSAALRTPDGLAVDGDGGLIIADKGNHRLLRVDATTGLLRTIAAAGPKGSERSWTPGPVVIDQRGTLWVGDLERNRVLRFDSGESAPRVIAGAGDIADGGPALAARLAHPGSVAVDTKGNIYIADTLHHRVRMVDSRGYIRTIAGTGDHGFNGDGIPATKAWLSYPAEIQVDRQGRVYVGDYYNNRVRRIDPVSGLISTVAGNGRGGEDGDGGEAIKASMLNPHALMLEEGKPDQGDSLIVASAVSSKLRRVDLRTGTITAMELGPAPKEHLVFYGLARWRGGLAMASPRPGGIEFLKDDQLSQLVGTPEVDFPQDVAVSPTGELFICETGRDRILRWGENGLEVVVENLGRPRALAFDAQGNLLVADTFHNRVLKVWLAPPKGGAQETARAKRPGGPSSLRR